MRTQSADTMMKYDIKPHNPDMTNPILEQVPGYDKAAVQAQISASTKALAEDIVAGRLPAQSQPRPHQPPVIADPGKGLLKVGMDVHLKQVTFVCQHGNQKAKSARQLPWTEVVERVRQWVAEGHHVVTVQESCGFGHAFHLALQEAGAHSLIVAPEALGRRKTDRLDARALCQRLANYLHGQVDELRPIRVPAASEIRWRDLSRHREFLLEEIKALAARGAALYRQHTHVELRSHWWGPRIFPKLKPALPAAIVDLLASYQTVLLQLDQLHQQTTAELTAPFVGQPLPLGLGLLCFATLQAEVCDWDRFNNRGQTGSFTGLTPGVQGSANPDDYRHGPIDRIGNGRIRRQLVEAVWRLINWQSEWHALKKVKARLGHSKAIRKKTVIALARQLMIDLWRWQTGRTTLAKLGLIPRLAR